jgi:hypothetical protein
MYNSISKTELLYNKSDPIDKLNIEDAINLMVYEQKEAVIEVEKSS